MNPLLWSVFAAAAALSPILGNRAIGVLRVRDMVLPVAVALGLGFNTV
jgi:hypothetical protein